MNSLLPFLLLSLFIQAIFFVFAFSLKTDKVTDLSYGLTFTVIAVIALFLGEFTIKSILLFLLIALWSIRLTSYLLRRILKMKSDKRFDGIRNSFFKFSRFWILQGVTVWVILLPAMIFFHDTSQEKFLTFSTLLGTCIFMLGFFIESVADAQKYNFKIKNQTKWINSGLWKYSKHPNYFGEILCWWGIFIFCLSSLTGSAILVGIISPLFIMYLLIFVSGIPPLEKSNIAKYGHLKEYRDYKAKTNLLIPLSFKLF